MVSSPLAKRKRLTIPSGPASGVYEVEQVLGHKLVKSELRFYIKCKLKICFCFESFMNFIFTVCH